MCLHEITERDYNNEIIFKAVYVRIEKKKKKEEENEKKGKFIERKR